MRIARKLSVILLWITAILLTLWCTAALRIDIRSASFANVFPAAFLAVECGALYLGGRKKIVLLVWITPVIAVMVWWFRLVPLSSAPWQTDVSRLARAETLAGRVTISNVRDFDYATETLYTPHWETVSIDIDKIRGVDLFIVHWGSPLIAHAIVSFNYLNGRHIAFSIEARKTVGQSYSAILGFFRQYTVIIIAAEERDVVRLRTNYRVGEEVRLYRTRMTPRDAQRLFLEYLKWIDRLDHRPEWYNALTQNCTTDITSFLARERIGGVTRLDWRTLLNGKGDEMLYQRGDLVDDGLPFRQLAQQAYINSAAQEAGSDADFSAWIRKGRVGFHDDAAR